MMTYVAVVLVSMVSGSIIQSPFDASDKEHGGVKMGIPNRHCDNAEWNLKKDWDGSSDQYTCKPEDHLAPGEGYTEECFARDQLPKPFHICMNKRIEYKDKPPVAGPHRPLWPVYGEYKYLPPQRWVHSLEHGAVVFLYHPCADPSQVKEMINMTRSDYCLWKHIITPDRDLGHQRKYPFAVIRYGCRLMMSQFKRKLAMDFIKKSQKYITPPEAGNDRQGDYNHELDTESKQPERVIMRLCSKQLMRPKNGISNWSEFKEFLQLV